MSPVVVGRDLVTLLNNINPTIATILFSPSKLGRNFTVSRKSGVRARDLDNHTLRVSLELNGNELYVYLMFVRSVWVPVCKVDGIELS